MLSLEEKNRLRVILGLSSSKQATVLGRVVKKVSSKFITKEVNPEMVGKLDEAGKMGLEGLSKLSPEKAEKLHAIHRMPGSQKADVMEGLTQLNKAKWESIAALPKTVPVRQGNKEVHYTWEQLMGDAKVPGLSKKNKAFAQQSIAAAKAQNTAKAGKAIRNKKLSNFGYSTLGTAALGAPVVGGVWAGKNLLAPQPSAGGFVGQLEQPSY